MFDCVIIIALTQFNWIFKFKIKRTSQFCSSKEYF